VSKGLLVVLSHVDEDEEEDEDEDQDRSWIVDIWI